MQRMSEGGLIDTRVEKISKKRESREVGRVKEKKRGQTKEKSFEDHGEARLECKAAYRAFIIVPASK